MVGDSFLENHATDIYTDLLLRHEARKIQDTQHASTVTDIRTGHRAYTCRFRNGEALEEQRAQECAEIAELIKDEKIIGDGHLIGKDDCWPDIAANFLILKDHWKKAENVHLVVPEYLKPSEAYLIQK